MEKLNLEEIKLSVLNSVRLNFPGIEIVFCFVHILRAFGRHCKTNLGNHFYKDKFQLEYFKVVSGIFFGAKSRYKKQFWNYHSLILQKQSFQLSTNCIESFNRSLKHFLGLGMCNQTRLNREMHLYHQQKVNLADAALNHGRMRTIRRQTLVHQDSLLNSLKEFEKPFLENSSFIDNSIDVPPLEDILPNMTELPSFLGKEFGDRQCGRITRSNSVRYYPIH